MTFAVRSIGGLTSLGRAVYFPTGPYMDLITDSVAPTISLEFYAAGTWSAFSNPATGTPVTPQGDTWLTGTGTGADYYIKLYTFSESGPNGGYTGSIDTWLDLSTTRAWTFTQTISHDPADPYFISATVALAYWPANYAILETASINFSISKIPTFGGG